eukprot:TRINITY_DN373_c1_g1_i3.p1 TRINITY_DN373_c1_g1~~TRINITY_DN373_c1_g1_i3.p1  ORF type:complete len:327 (+),score=63.10 TRINITY_DN373_c1_g1_i3:32-1012(+)
MARLGSLLKDVSPNKKVGAMLGALVADAASLPLEWIYKDEKMKEIVGNDNPEFWKECHCPFFTVPCGINSCYGDEARISLKALASTEGEPGVDTVSQHYADYFGSPDSPYQIALAKRADKKYPVPGPWINGGVIQFLKNKESGVNPTGSADCEDNDGYAAALPVILKTGSGFSNFAEILTTNEMTLQHVKMQNEILNNYLKGVEDPIRAAQTKLATEVPEVCKEIEQVFEAVQSGKSLGEIVESFGKACSLPGSFLGSLAALVIYKDDYASAIRNNILSGGDCCSRGLFIGACIAAKVGVQGIPSDWIEKVTGVEEILENAAKVFN